MKTLVIGRHTLTAEDALKWRRLGIDVTDQQNIQFPAKSIECELILNQLIDQGGFQIVLFQAIPNQLAVALARFLPYFKEFNIGVGAVVSVPGDRPDTQTAEFFFDEYIHTAQELAWCVNPRAKLSRKLEGTTLVVSVEPPMPFTFSHIEWFHKRVVIHPSYYPKQKANSYELANFIYNLEPNDPDYNNPLLVRQALQLIESLWIFVGYDAGGEEIWQKPNEGIKINYV